MKSVLISIQPKWVDKIASGEKTIEVRKTRPKLETPFKCYICCTKAKNKEERLILQPFGYALGGLESNFTYRGDGKVIGEFVCDRIVPFDVPYPAWSREYLSSICDGACLNYGHLHSYIGSGNRGYGWHISDLKIYDKPKELFDFANYVKYQVCKERNCFSDNCWICDNNALIVRPPQSWCYVESLGE